MGLMNCFVDSMLSPRNVPATGFSDCHNRPQKKTEGDCVFNPRIGEEYLKKIPGLCCAGLSY